jgi:hypothetical protein
MSVERKETEKVGLRFSETMSGYLAQGVEDFGEGEKKGQEQDNRCFTVNPIPAGREYVRREPSIRSIQVV